METKEIVDMLAKGSPEAVIVMRPNDLKGFAMEVGRQAMAGTGPKWLPKRKSNIGLKGYAQAHLVRDLLELFPKTNTHRLAEALGVSRQYLSKVLKLTEKAEASIRSGEGNLFGSEEYDEPRSPEGGNADTGRRLPLEAVIQQLVDDRIEEMFNESKMKL